MVRKIALLVLTLLAVGLFAGPAAAKARSKMIWEPIRGPVIYP